jgi:aminoglycoside phosphotransferase (APT) family kinase protein
MNNLEQLIAVGRTAEIFAYEDGKVLKLFFPTVPRLWIEKEIGTGRHIQATQLPVPKVYERMELDDRIGVVYERIEGPSLLNELARKPWNTVRYARLLANLHAQVHQVSAPLNLETQKDWARGGIPETEKLSEELRGRVLDLLDSMPEGDKLCHGDFHPGNIIVTDRGPIIIDWMTVSRGVGSGDVARAATILEAAKAPEGTPMRWLLEWVRKLFLKTYLETYFELRPTERQSFAAWRTIMAANYLADVSLPEEEKDLMAIIEDGLGSV